jgi:hypothetical protein
VYGKGRDLSILTRAHARAQVEEDLDLDSCDMAELVTRGACHTRLQCLESDRKITLGQMRLLSILLILLEAVVGLAAYTVFQV